MGQDSCNFSHPALHSSFGRSSRCVTSLKTQIGRVDAAFDQCNSVWCSGEAEGFFTEKFLDQILVTIYRCYGNSLDTFKTLFGIPGDIILFFRHCSCKVLQSCRTKNEGCNFCAPSSSNPSLQIHFAIHQTFSNPQPAQGALRLVAWR